MSSDKELKCITKEELLSQLDKNNRNIEITDEVVEIINESMNEPEFDGFRFVETFLTYQKVLTESKGSKLMDYVNAVRFCSFLETTDGNAVQAYIKTFLKREFVQERMNLSTSDGGYKELCSAATRYRKSPLVVGIITQAEIPLYILFQGYRYKAVSVLVKEMTNEKAYPKDRIAAADKLLTHVKPPENFQMQLDVKVDETTIVDKYEEAMKRMVEDQKKLISAGGNIDEIINVKVIEDEN